MPSTPPFTHQIESTRTPETLSRVCSTPGPGLHCYFRELSGSPHGRQWLLHMPVRHKRLPCLAKAYVRVAKRDPNLAARSQTQFSSNSSLYCQGRAWPHLPSLPLHVPTLPSSSSDLALLHIISIKTTNAPQARREGVGWKLSQQEVITGKWLILKLLKLLNKEVVTLSSECFRIAGVKSIAPRWGDMTPQRNVINEYCRVIFRLGILFVTISEGDLFSNSKH